MSDVSGTVWIITGGPGAGKSSVSRALLQRFEFGLHLAIDDLNDLVVSGRAYPSLEHPPEAARQFALAHTAAAHHARLYTEAGFEVAIDDVLWPTSIHALLADLKGSTVRVVLLAPGLETALARNAARTNKTYDTATLVPLMEAIHPSIRPEEYRAHGWTVLDTSGLTLEETVDALLAEQKPKQS
ncbi:AAA family ATPase [Deinococcus sp.]|uniref:AAA family ATPase n=1 Tax=Deinococcus sp. TaxID=47478 RepID=UPI00286E3C92|nr:AAA family ATPase [Deinococcus sp.]